MNLKWSLVLMLISLIITMASASAFHQQRKEHKGEKYTRYENHLMLMTMYASLFLVIGLSNTFSKQFGMSEDVRNSWIMVWFCIPSSFVTTIFIPWLLEYFCSINTVLSGKIVPKVVTTNFEGDESLNLGMTNLGKGLIYLAWGIPAVAFWAFPNLSAVFIEYWEYGIESQLNLLANGSTFQKFMLAITIILIFVIIWNGYVYFNNIYKNVKEWLVNKQKYRQNRLPYPVKSSERNFILSIVLFKIYTYWYLYGFNKIAMRNMLFWLGVIFIVFIIYWINFFVKNWNITQNYPTPINPDDDNNEDNDNDYDDDNDLW